MTGRPLAFAASSAWEKARELLDKLERIKLENELHMKDIWAHAASILGYESIGDLHDDDKMMRCDTKEHKVELRKSEYPRSPTEDC